MKINFPLLALAIGAFGIGTTEFSPMGLLPVIAKGVDVSIPVAGMLISAYAIGVMVGAPLMTLLLSHRARRNALIFLMGIFTVGNLLSSIAPDYTTLLLSRIITSLNHGAFFGLGSVVAASVVPKHKQASAVATMFMGLTIANIGGVPAATWLGDTIGWRMSFLETFFVVVAHPLLDFVAGKLQLIGADHHLFAIQPQRIFMPGTLPGTLAALHGARSLLHFVQQSKIAFHLLVEPVANRLVIHRHSHLYHSGNIAQKFVIHSLFLCKGNASPLHCTHAVIIAADRKKKSVAGGRFGNKNAR